MKKFLLYLMLSISGYLASAQCSSITPPTLPTSDSWQSITVDQGAYYFVTGIKSDGSLWAWGNNDYHQLGDGTKISRTVPELIDVNTNWKAVSSGTGFTTGIKTDETLWIWGNSNIIPTQIGVDNDWRLSSPGQNLPVAIKTDGTLWSWDDKFTPFQIGSDTDWSTASAATSHVLALKSNGTLWSWGNNAAGQLGYGNYTEASVPTQVGAATDWKSISAHVGTSFAIKSDGTLWGWGYNYQQWPDGANIKTIPTQIGSDANWESVSSSSYHTVAIKTDGTLWGWGANHFGEQANGIFSEDILTTPTQIGTDTDWVSASASYGYTIAKKKDGSLWSWGLNSYGQLGIGTSGNSFNTQQHIVSIAEISFQNLCRITTIADLSVNGSNIQWYSTPTGGMPLSAITPLESDSHYYATQTIDGCESSTRLEVIAVRATPPPAPAGSSAQTFCYGATLAQLTIEGNDIKWYDAASGGSLLSSSTVMVPGQHYYASQSIGSCESTSRLELAPTVNFTPLPSGATNQSICQGYSLSDIIVTGTNIKFYDTPSGGTELWRNNWLVDGAHYYVTQTLNSCESERLDIKISLIVIPAPTGNASQEFCSAATIADLKADGTDIKWYSIVTTPLSPSAPVHTGYYYASQTLNSCESVSRFQVGVTVTPNTVASPVYNTPNTWKLISSGSRYAIGIKTDGSLWAWGDNYYGQFGNGTNANSRYPVQIGEERNWKTIDASGFTTFAIKNDGTLWAWGDNQFGQLGNGTTANKNIPTQIGADKWKSISYDYTHVLGIKTDGTLWSWGNNEKGQLGDGTFTNRYTPAQIGTGKNWTSVATGIHHSVGLKADGTLWTWGEDYYHQLGDGDLSLISKNVPQKIGSDTDWNYITANVFTSFAIKKNGTLWGWGGDLFGEFGDQTHGVNRTTPTQIGTNTNWQSIAPSGGLDDFHTVAIKTDGTLWAWGSSREGQLGDGTTSDSYKPMTHIGTANDWHSITIGDAFSLAIKNDGTLWFWGGDGYGIPSYCCQFLDRSSTPVFVYSSAATKAQTFCSTSTIANLVATGTNVQWYPDATSTTPLSSATVLQDGTHYFATQKVGVCESVSRLEIIALINLTPTPAPTGLSTQSFCGKPTVSNLITNEDTQAQIKWYSIATGGNSLSPATLLVSNTKYYAAQSVASCESVNRLEVTAAVHPVPQPPTGQTIQTIDTGKTVGDLIVSGNDIKWYTASGTLLSSATLLENDSTYYATQTSFGCESQPLAVEVLLVTGIESIDPALRYHPNPVKDNLIISCDNPIDQVVVKNMIGQTLITKELLSTSSEELNLTSLESGLFIVQVRTNGKLITLKIVKE